VPFPDLLKLPVVAAEFPEMVRVVAAVVTSIAPVVPFEIVNPRSVVTLAPVYESVPPANTRFDVALLELPMLLLPPPLASVVTLSVPALIVVVPL